jgi:TAG lipase / steryl ester hydrolase / phospholipase A2 / LPA acyltransferase
MIRTLENTLANASCYEEWRNAAQKLDELTGMDYWKETDRTGLYDYRSIRRRLDSLRELLADGNQRGVLYALNEGIHGNMGGMGNMRLYTQARFGTKTLIVEFIEEMVAALQFLASSKSDKIPLAEKLDFFQRASHCAGRSALMLSGSGSLFYFHLGVVKALWEADLLPPILSGASGGALVSALAGTHSREELARIFEPEHIRIEIQKEAGSFLHSPFLKNMTFSRKTIEDMLERLIPDLTFKEAREKTGLNINVSVAPASRHQSSRLLNAIASPDVLIREALLASSAFPGVFPPVTLKARNENGERINYLPGRKWIDGSVTEDLPIRRVARLYGVNHFIVSQTNPVALPFIRENKEPSGLDTLSLAMRNSSREWLLAATRLIGNSSNTSRPGVAQLFRMTSSVLAQTYTGDINILPPTRFHNPLRLLSSRTTDEILEMIRAGERSSWPKIEAIRLQTRISRTLDAILADLETQILKQAS